MKEMSHIFAKIVDQYRFKFESTFLVLFNKYGEDIETPSEIELPITLSNTHNLTQPEIDNINIQWTLEIRIQSVELKNSGWNYRKINRMGTSFFESGELNGSSL